MDLGSALAGVVGTSLVGYLVYSYRNTITYKIVSIDGYVSIIDGKLAPPTDGSRDRIISDRFEFKNYGLRKLRDVELHMPARNDFISCEVTFTDSIAHELIALNHQGGNLIIRIPTMPKGETVRVSLMTSGYYLGENRSVRGNGGDYRVVEDKIHKFKRDFLLFAFLWAVITIVTNAQSVYDIARYELQSSPHSDKAGA